MDKETQKQRLQRLEDLAVEWRHATRRQQNKIFKEVAKFFMNYIYNKTTQDSQYDREECISLYYMEVLRCLNLYEGRNGATFMTMLWFSIKRIPPEYFNRIKPTVKNTKWRNIINYGDLIETL
jgi:hypothetical protein